MFTLRDMTELKFTASVERLSAKNNDEAELSSSEVNNTNRRCTANRRERIRMCQLNKAFYELKKKLPWIPHDTKLTKLEILVFAAQYIEHLTKQLQQR